MEIRIFVTGGTIDDVDIDRKTDAKGTRINSLLSQARVSLPVAVEMLMSKDSREISEKDRELIAKKCRECKETKLIITHGTYTMSETAAFLAKRIRNKTVVLVGSMVSSTKKNSDALFNLGSSLIAVQTLPHGVYITMEG
ncbi:MAG: asparaginase domain-containing protein, partial [Candidatus ainarchaeum sp.]|nr:asparaginase domain-containing protein [Candidatus ainarchaeum sp.]